MKDIEIDSIKSILIVSPNWVGDFVMATPIFGAIRKTFPSSKIVVLVKPNLAALGKGATWCDDFFLYDRRVAHRGTAGWIRMRRELRREKFDMAFILPNSIRSGLIGKLSGARYRLGYDRPGGGLLLSHKISRPREGKKFLPVYGGFYYAKILESFFPVEVKQKLDLPALPEHDEFARNYWDGVYPKKGQLKIAIAPGASFGSSKLWPSKYYSELIDLIAEKYDSKLLLVPGPGEEELSGEIKANSKSQVSILPPAQGNLDVLRNFLEQADLLISNDSGARHVAHAMGTKTIVLMGPTDPRHSENPDAECEVLRNVVPCSPCYLKKCRYDHHDCMVGINPSRVFETVKSLLA